MFDITIFTPTYNRGDLLGILYKSLLKQSFKNFEWIVYDDGSNDNTKDIITNFKKENKINITYVKDSNKGKHSCINKGTEMSQGELFFIVDSDDYLLVNSLSIIMRVWNSIEDKNKFAGVGGRKVLHNNSKKFNFSTKYFDCNQSNFSLKHKNNKDKAEVYKTSILKKYKFPEFAGENFITEAVVWYKLDNEGYLLRWFNEDIYIGKYLQDGLSQNFYKKRIENIRGTCLSYNLLSSYNIPFMYKLRYKINYFRYGLTKYKLSYLKDKLIDKKYIYITSIIGFFFMIFDRK